MSERIKDNKRIVSNTLFLYIRMFLIMAVTLYASRVVLDKLGVDDYGIYHSVSGVVAMLAFLNNTLSTGTSRFLTFELGKGNKDTLSETFNTAFYAHLLLAIIVVILFETVGIWFIQNKLIIPASRLIAAKWVFHISVITTFVSITQVPYTSVIIAHENMKVYAYVGIFDAIARLAIVFLLSISPFDRLIFYAFLVACVQLLVLVMYRMYCVKKYHESILRKVFNKNIFNNIISFSGLSLVANISQIVSNQGLVILINMFFQPSIVAAQAVGNQLSTAVTSFVSNLRTAINPQIIKLYATGQYEESKKLTLTSSIYVHELVLFFALPLIVIMEPLLHYWLVDVPDYAVIFAQCIMIKQIFDVYNASLYTPMIASGELKTNSIASVLFSIGLFVVLYILLKMGFSVMWVQYLSIIQVFVFSYLVKPWILCKELNYTWTEIFHCFLKCFIVSALPVAVSVIMMLYFNVDNFISMLLVASIICFSVLISSYIFLDKDTKRRIHRVIIRVLKRK